MSQELNSFVIFTLLPPCCFGHLGQAEDDEGSALRTGAEKNQPQPALILGAK